MAWFEESREDGCDGYGGPIAKSRVVVSLSHEAEVPQAFIFKYLLEVQALLQGSPMPDLVSEISLHACLLSFEGTYAYKKISSINLLHI